MNDEYETVYKDELIQIGIEDSKYYLTFIPNQVMIRFDFVDWKKLMSSMERYLNGH